MISTFHSKKLLLAACVVTVSFITGCATTESSTSGASSSPYPARYKATDGRTISIGRSVAADGGWSFKEPHLEKCWIADGFNFTDYDTLYIAPTLSTAKFHDDEIGLHEVTKEKLPVELKRQIEARSIFTHVVTQESEIAPGARVLKLENTITEYSKGGGAARFWAGLYGAGQPVLRVEGKMTEGSKPVFTFQIRRSGVSGGARMFGGTMTDEDIQTEDIRSMTLDLTDFMAAIAGKYTVKP
jgi:hypothetical protein